VTIGAQARADSEPEPHRSAEAGNARVDSSRIPAGMSLRRHAARGTIVNSAFQLGLFGLGTAQRVVVAIWLTRADYGMWGILLAALIALTWIKNFGIADKYIQQSEPDQEVAFQKAFTIELGLSMAFFVVVCFALPVYAVAYGRPAMILPGIVLAISMPLTAFESPAWIAYRRLQYARQRALTFADPLTAFVLSITLAAAGFGYWGLVIGTVAGSLCGGLVCTITCPYRLRLRLDRATIKEYVHFSLPLVGFGLCGFVTLQGMMLVANTTVGLAGIGAIGLASNLTRTSDGIDTIISQTIYPAICAVAHRTEALAEAFVKSNRLALMWAMPAMVGIALFSGDIIHFVLGDRWRSAIGLIVVVALVAGFSQVGYNWAVFLRAVNNTRPIFIGALAQVVVFVLVTAPAMLTLGMTGYSIGLIAAALSQIFLRGYYMRRLFGGFSAFRPMARAVLPTLPPTALVLLMRAVSGGERSPARVVLELALYSVVAVGSTVLLERPLLRECVGYFRGIRPQKLFAVRGSEPQVRSSQA